MELSQKVAVERYNF